MKKPPIGIMPKRIWEKKRFLELEETIQRYIDATEELPKEWLEEFYDLYQKIYKGEPNT